MSNEFYVNGDTLVGGTTANAADVKAEFDNIQTGFDKLPTEAQLKSGNLNYAVDSGAANAYVVAMPQTWTAYTAGWHLTFKVSNANTGASTINVDGLGVKSIKKTDGSALVAGDLVVGALVTLGYDGTNFQVLSHVQGVVDAAENARDAAQTAQAAAETAQTGAETAETNAVAEVTYAQEWAVKAEDSLVSVAAGGDGSTEYSAYHWAKKAEADAATINIPSLTGNEGKALHVASGESTMEWLDPGAIKLLQTVSLSGETAVDFTLPTGYSKFIVEGSSLGGVSVSLRTSTDGGTTFDSGTTDYQTKIIYNQSTTDAKIYSNQTSSIQAVIGQVDFFTLQIFDPYAVSDTGILLHAGGLISATRLDINVCAAFKDAAEAVDAVRIFGSTYSSGTMKLYGVK